MKDDNVLRFKHLSGSFEEMRAQNKKDWEEAHKAIDQGKPICLSDLIGNAENVYIARLKNGRAV